MALKNNRLYRLVLIFLIVFGALQVKAQLINHYWSQSYNSMSSLLSGAVVAGDAGNAAIFYNPANIVEIEEGNNVSIAASFLTLSDYYLKNAFGNGKDLNSTNFYVQPQFFSVGVNSPLNNLSFEVAAFNRGKEQVIMDFAETENINPDEMGEFQQRRTSQYHYKNFYSDDWIGIGGAYKISEDFYVGISLNVSISSLSYNYFISSQIHDLNADTIGNIGFSSYSFAENEYTERLDFTNIRLISRIGISYKTDKWQFGLNLSLPPLNVFTVGEKAIRSQKETYYDSEGTSGELVDYFVFDAGNYKTLKANYKLPFSAAFGVVYKMNNNKRLYSTIEYFAGLKPYKMIDAPLSTDFTSDIIYNALDNKDWLSYAYGAVPVLNIAIGYRWQIRPNVLFLTGLRTNFNNIRNYDYGSMESYAKINTTEMNLFHATGGVQFQYKKHSFVAGTQLTFGMQRDTEQIADFSNEIKPNLNSSLPLFGERKGEMDIYYFSISLFLGATLNFESKKQNPKP